MNFYLIKQFKIKHNIKVICSKNLSESASEANYSLKFVLKKYIKFNSSKKIHFKHNSS